MWKCIRPKDALKNLMSKKKLISQISASLIFFWKDDYKQNTGQNEEITTDIRLKIIQEHYELYANTLEHLYKRTNS